MYRPQYVISNQILNNIGVVEGCREVIASAPIIPAWEKRFVEEARVRTVHYGTAIEGNALSYDQAKAVMEGEDVVARDRDIQEVLNYRNVMNYLDELWNGHRTHYRDMPFEYGDEQVKYIQHMTVDRLIESGVGEYRKTQVVVRSVRMGETSFRAPQAVEVPYLMEAFLRWLNSLDSRSIHPVLRAGITHYVLAAIHPFVEGNGRTARAVATLVLFVEGYDIRKLFSLEEYFDRDVMSYYAALQSVSSQSERLEERDLTPWLEYFTKVLAIELTRVKEQVQNLSLDLKLKNKVGRQIALSDRQITLVEFMKDHEALYMRDAKGLVPDVSDDTLLRDLNELIDKKLVKKVGKTKAARYVLVG